MKKRSGFLSDPMIFAWLFGLLSLLFILNLFLGSVIIPIGEVFRILFGESTAGQTESIIVLNFRLPQTITALFTGAALAVAGLMMQTLFRNPLADPSILGISSGAGLGVAILLFFTGTVTSQVSGAADILTHLGLNMAAFIGALAVLLLILFISNKLRNAVSLLIVGIMIAYVAGALVGIVKYFSRKEDVYAFALWGLGSFSNVGNSQLPVFIVSICIGLVFSVLMMKSLNLLLLGDRYAANLGLNIRMTTIYIVIITGFLTAIVTAYAGPIAFIGLAVPHLSRSLFKTADHKVLLPATMILGSCLALFCNLVSRLPGFDGSLPINSVTSLIGAPIVIWFIFKHRNFSSQES
ncbi:MAG: iron ABC transporter permease [Bacteroidales bacterium]|nr:iron ABC transporter permease [Bacteroidales bacterium]